MANVKCDLCGHLFSDEKFDECPNCPEAPAKVPAKKAKPVSPGKKSGARRKGNKKPKKAMKK